MRKARFKETEIVRVLKEVERVWDIRCDLLQLESQVRRHGDRGHTEAEGTRGREPAPEADVRRSQP
jgi:hypothetical protein